MENKSFGEMWSSLTEEQRKYLSKYIDRQRQNAVEIYIEKQCNIVDISNLLCGFFQIDPTMSSATKCICGREKWQHLKAT